MPPRTKLRRCLPVLVLLVLFLTMMGVFIASASPTGPPQERGAVLCLDDPITRTFDIVAVQLNIVINKAGEHDPNGLLYVLKEDKDDIRRKVEANPLTPVEEVRPLIIRANAGDYVEVNFTNELSFPASMHIKGVQYDVLNSDGTAAGKNPSSVAQPGETVKYRWYADKEGTFLFNDLGNPVADETGSNVHGLWGALIVEAPGSTWTDPETGEELGSGLYADIHHPDQPDFREYTVIFHDEMEVASEHQASNGHGDGEGLVAMLVNYRSEPSRIRHDNPNVQGEKAMMSSWVWGDPATPVLHAYVGDPAKIRLIHAGVKETHVFHLHVYQWRLNPRDPDSTLIDSISIGPQESYTIEPLFGAGSRQGAPGDAIWHCHLYPHFDEGMWGLWRTHDVREDGSRQYPDGSPIRALQPLPDRPLPPQPTPDKPGYPLYIPGTFGEQAPRPPLGVIDGREPTPLEQANFDLSPVPGGAIVNPGPPGAPVREFHIVGIQLPIKYNDAGWHDPEGRVFVLAEDEDAVRSGKKPVEPLVIRANAGEVIDVTFTNKFPETLGGNAFQTKQITDEAGLHIHLVKFDVICSDGGANGWNYDSSTSPGESIRYRWYADSELRTVFFHDHLFANLHQQHGVFAALIIEPACSTYHDPYTGEEIKSGTKAVIKNANFPDFREFALAVHDFALLFDARGNPVNPPPQPGSDQDPGVMAINYRNEPFQFRDGDPAYVFSSYVHGDPVTPLLEAYAGDPVRIRLFQGAHEEQHAFNLHGYKWLREPTNPESPKVSQQTIGISEAFNFEFTADAKGEGDQDLLYYSGGIDDLWLGMWGIMRVYGSSAAHLRPLEDRPEPAPRTAALPSKTGCAPAVALDPGKLCVPDAKVKKYDVVAIANKIVYNSAGDNDPDGLMFVLKCDEEAVLKGQTEPRPLIIRANVGDCVEVRLTNKLPEQLPPTVYPQVPVEAPWPPSNRVSMHVQNLQYDARGSDGATVGFNPDQTIGPGETIVYRWFADQEGVFVLSNFGDLRNHRHRGLFGALVVEPPGAKYYDPSCNTLFSGDEAIIKLPSGELFREFVVLAHNGVSLFDKNGNRIPDPPGVDDKEDQGHRAFNYRSERFANRLVNNPDRSLVFSSEVHGDPATPLFRAYVGDPVIFRYAMVGDKPRNSTFAVHGHSWLSQPGNPLSNVISVHGATSVGSTGNIELLGNAGGPDGMAGDFLYSSSVIRWDLEDGMWGIFRVYEQEQKDLKPLK